MKEAEYERGNVFAARLFLRNEQFTGRGSDGRALDCRSRGRGFKSRRPRQIWVRSSRVEHSPLKREVASSSLAGPTIRCGLGICWIVGFADCGLWIADVDWAPCSSTAERQAYTHASTRSVRDPSSNLGGGMRDCGLRIADCGIAELRDRRVQNSAIRIPQSRNPRSSEPVAQLEEYPPFKRKSGSSILPGPPVWNEPA